MPRGTSKRGFAAMDPSEQRRIASMGGRASRGDKSRSFASRTSASNRSRGSSQRSNREKSQTQ